MTNFFSVVVEFNLPTFQNCRRLNDPSHLAVAVVSDDVDVEPEVKIGEGAFDKVVEVVGVEGGPVGLGEVAVQNLSGA